MLADLVLYYSQTNRTLVILHLQTGTSMQATVDPGAYAAPSGA